MTGGPRACSLSRLLSSGQLRQGSLRCPLSSWQLQLNGKEALPEMGLKMHPAQGLARVLLLCGRTLQARKVGPVLHSHNDHGPPCWWALQASAAATLGKRVAQWAARYSGAADCEVCKALLLRRASLWGVLTCCRMSASIARRTT